MSEKDGEDENFKKRVDSIFGHLDDIQKKHENVVTDYEKCIYPLKYNIQFQSEDKLEKTACKNKDVKRKLPKQVPDHVLNPQKWKKYSLEEDGSNIENGLSADDLNRQVAFGFLESLKKRKTDCQLEKDSINQINPVFKKPNERKDFLTQTDFSDSVHNGLSHVMNTFEFGESSSSAKRLPKPNPANLCIVNKLDFNFNDDDANESVIADKEDVLNADPIIFKKNISSKKFRKRAVDDGLEES